MTFKGQQNSKKVNILGVYFDHVTMSEMVENIKTFSQHQHLIICL